MQNTLICTVGTSLLNNLKRSEETIQTALSQQNWQQIALYLNQQHNTDRVCGAEINSITRICEKQLLNRQERLILLVSETEDGQATGQLLKQYYQHRDNPIPFKTVEVRVLKGLRDDNVNAFRQEGLKNLVREISTEVNKFSPETIAINATGGYKAQISFAGMIGQALGIPVYYLFERFSEVIELPPQPIALDLGFWIDHYVLFEQLEAEEILKKAALADDFDEQYFPALIDEVEDEGTILVTLSATGILFHERSRLQFQKQKTTALSFVPQTDTLPEKKPIHLREDHGQDVLLPFAKKLTRSPYITKVINSLPFNPKQANPIRKTSADGIIELVLTWTDQGFGLCLQTTGRNLRETNAIAIHLVNKFT
ncbi:MAG: putative CRISPR-associated protein [Cyanobacteria bacterium]|nr:putative CRISPR-associated protein [Cyanobacteria bacterium GSL.Bin21]